MSPASFGLAFLAGVLIFASYPPPDLWPVAYVAFVPLLVALARTDSRRGALLLGLLSGFVGQAPALVWVASVTVPGWIGLSLYLSLYLAAGAVAFQFFQRRFPAAWPVLVAAGWVTLEFVRARLGPGFPWLLLGYTQHPILPLVQVSTVTGVFGLTFLVVFTAAALAQAGMEAWRWRAGEGGRFSPLRAVPAVAAVALIAVCYAGGRAALRGVEVTDGPVLGVVQQNKPPSVSDLQRSVEEFSRENVKELEHIADLSTRLEGKGVRLLVWSETVVMAPLNISPDIIRNPHIRRVVSTALGAVRRLGDRMGCYFLVGARGWFERSVGYVERTGRSRTSAIANSVMMFSPEGRFQERYDKIQLVPFGEYIPLVDWLPFLKVFTPFRRGLTPGTETVVFRLPAADPDGREVGFGALICYEDVFPELVRQFVAKGADFLVNATEEGWYRIPGELRQHLAMAKFRAVENRRTVVRCANTGISCFIGPSGEIYRYVEKEVDGELKRAWVEGTASAPVRLCDESTFYTRYGDAFAWGCVLFSVLVGAAAVALGRRRPGGAGTSEKTQGGRSAQ